MSNNNTNYVSYLIELSQQGRRNAFFDLCEINLKSLYSFIYYITADAELANQISLNVFFHAWDSIKEFRITNSYLDWLKDFAIKHCLFEIKRKGLRTSFKPVEKTVISKLHQIERLIFALPDEERILFVFHDMNEMDYNAILKYMPNLTQDEIKTKIVIAREFILDNL